MNVIVILLIAGTASARHVLDLQLNTHDTNGDVVVERRNIGYISLVNRNPENTPYVNSDLRQNDKTIRTKTNERYAQPTVKYHEQNHEDFLNNISNDEYDHRLRTNSYTTEAYSTTEYLVQNINVYTNRKEQTYTAESKPVNQDVKSGQMDQRNTQNVGFIKCNKPKLRPEIRPADINQERRRPSTALNISIQNSQNVSTYNITKHPKEPVNIKETVLIQPIPSEETRGQIDRLPKTDTDEQIWVWGTERTNETSTEPGSLDDRAAFSGDKCPTGKAKVQGICVEKH